MADFKTLHPDIYSERMYSKTKTYRNYNENGELLEAFDKNENGEWIDVTERELERIKIAELLKELEKLNAKAMEDAENVNN